MDYFCGRETRFGIFSSIPRQCKQPALPSSRDNKVPIIVKGLSCRLTCALMRLCQVRIVAVPEVREAHGRFPCDRHRDRSELELMFGDTVDFSLCDFKVRHVIIV